jgi:hypothetical protein
MSPSLHVSMSPCHHISMSPCLNVCIFSMLPCLHVSMLPCSMFPCLHLHISMSPCIRVSISPCFWNFAHGNWNYCNRKWQFPFVCCKQKMEMTNFRSFAVKNRKRLLLVQHTCPSMPTGQYKNNVFPRFLFLFCSSHCKAAKISHQYSWNLY